MATSKEMRVLVRQAKKAGCTVERLKNGHTRVTTPSGEFHDLSYSPGTHKGVRDQQFKIAKLLRKIKP